MPSIRQGPQRRAGWIPLEVARDDKPSDAGFVLHGECNPRCEHKIAGDETNGFDC